MEFSLSNTAIIAFVIAVVFIVIYFVFKKDMEPQEENIEEDKFSIYYLNSNIKDLFNEITNQNIAELYLNRKETKKREQQKARLNNALRSCAQGNVGEKEYVKDYIKELLQCKLNINEKTINQVIPFHSFNMLTEQDKFEILLHVYKKEYGTAAFEKLSNQCGFDKPKTNENGTYYEITKEDIANAYYKCAEPLKYIDKIEIVAQRVFELVYGFSCADVIREMNIDGLSGGVSGVSNEQYNYMEEIFENSAVRKPKTYDSLWIFYHGKAIYLSFMGFGSQHEIIRVCKNLYMYDNVGHLTSSNGYKLTYLQDSSRVVVVRPKLVANWAFFVRKFDSAKSMTVNELLKDRESETVIELVKWMVKGCLNIVLSGDQNSGKTTFLRAMAATFIDQRYPIRTTEHEYELWLNNANPNLNCVAFRHTDEVSIIDSINLQKKTDASILLLGEVQSAELARAFIDLTQSGTKATWCTCHCVSTEDLVDYFRNAMLYILSNDQSAEEQVANAINIDIHWEKSGDGHRYISYIKEIIPFSRGESWPVNKDDCIVECLKTLARRRTFTTRDIIVYEKGTYVYKNPLSDRLAKKILRNLLEEEKDAFVAFNNHSIKFMPS